ncbi:peptidyl-tRNA hydrolase [Ignicoccus pacificus DSM 13166]|uniref:Peptidyl-tRNA hydrolase n=1 Tax=Ignicoccus pacificus DSM 13166 TaxID=940294 RepID=A0A977KAB2_9CREN|nr:peptidyl-tRNA hydrolase [Ignicoccus pacificus DSM 13166]
MEIKQVIVVRTDLKMGKGKLAAQVAHASCEAVFEAMRKKPSWVEQWRLSGQKKIVLKVNTELELKEIYVKARSMGLPASMIADAGLTQLPPGTVTAVGIGPAPSSEIDKITGKLKLL